MTTLTLENDLSISEYETIKFKKQLKQNIYKLEAIVKTIKDVQYDVDVITDSEVIGDLIDNVLEPLNCKISELRLEYRKPMI